jgi:hypothetical protein
MRLVSMLYSYPRQNFAAPPRCSPNTRPGREGVYPKNNREMMSKLCLRLEQTMETNPIYASVGCPKNMDNLK